MRTYEITILLSPELTADAVQKAQDSFSKLITDNGGKVQSSESWGKKMLAYKIKKQDEATYLFIVASLDPAKAQAFEQSVKLSEGVLRHMVILANTKQGQE